MANILVLHGPNLNMLGQREPEHYGTTTLNDLNQSLQALGEAEGHHVVTFQTNAEYALIERIQATHTESIDFIIINPAAWTHTSIAIRDALIASKCPFIEVHISNIYAREPFRHHSYLADIAVGTITGLGAFGYQAALCAACDYLAHH